MKLLQNFTCLQTECGLRPNKRNAESVSMHFLLFLEAKSVWLDRRSTYRRSVSSTPDTLRFMSRRIRKQGVLIPNKFSESEQTRQPGRSPLFPLLVCIDWNSTAANESKAQQQLDGGVSFRTRSSRTYAARAE